MHGIVALFGRRARRDLFHSALEIVVPDGRYIVQMTPIRDDRGAWSGQLRTGGVRWVGRFRLFRYDIHRWRSGRFADA